MATTIMTQRSSFGTRVAAQIRNACPLFPNVIVDVILRLGVGAKNYNVCAPDPVQMAEFDFLYTEKKSATKILNIFSDRDKVIGSFGGKEFSRSQEDKFFQSMLDLTGGKEILANQIELDPEIFSTIASAIQDLVPLLKHPNKVVVKPHKLLIFEKGTYSCCSQNSNEGQAIFAALVPLKMHQLELSKEGGFPCDDSLTVVTVFNPQDTYGLAYAHDSPGFLLAFEVFDSGLPNPCARAIPTTTTTAPAAFTKAIAMGFNKVALRAKEQIGPSRQVKPHQLRGTDRVFAEYAQANGAKFIEVCEVYSEADGIATYRPEILNIVKVNDSFVTLFEQEREESSEEEDSEEDDERAMHRKSRKRARDDEEGEESGEGEDSEEDEAEKERAMRHKSRRPARSQSEAEEEGPPPRLQRCRALYDDNISPRYDETGRFVAVRDEYRLGDTLFLSLEGTSRVVYSQTRLRAEREMGGILASFVIMAHF